MPTDKLDDKNGPESKGSDKARPLIVRCLVGVLGPLTRKNALHWVGAFLLLLIVRWLLVDWFYIPSASMEPTLNGDERFFHADRVAVNKFIYGPRIPFMDKRIFRLKGPQRWDIVVFNTYDENFDKLVHVKRVVGLPGERVRIEKGKLHINGEVVEPPEELRDIINYTYGPEISDSEVRAYMIRLARYDEIPPVLNPEHEGAKKFYEYVKIVKERLKEMPDGKLSDEQAKKVLHDFNELDFTTTHGALWVEIGQAAPYLFGIQKHDVYSVVPGDSYFVLGDNSGHSADGRVFGWLPNNLVLGKAFCIWWPLSRRRDLTGFSSHWVFWSIVAVIVAMGVVWELRKHLGKKKQVEQTDLSKDEI